MELQTKTLLFFKAHFAPPLRAACVLRPGLTERGGRAQNAAWAWAWGLMQSLVWGFAGFADHL